MRHSHCSWLLQAPAPRAKNSSADVTIRRVYITMLRPPIALIIIFLTTRDGLCLTIECNTERNMARCCELFEKSLHEKLPQFGDDLAHQCENEIVGARDQVAQQKSFDACIPDDVTNEHLSALYRAYVKNHPEFWDRPARFGMLNVWSLSWPCSKR